MDTASKAQSRPSSSGGSTLLREVVRQRLFGHVRRGRAAPSPTNKGSGLVLGAVQGDVSARERSEAHWRLKRASAVAAVVWLAFGLLDALVQRLGAGPLEWFWGWRLVGFIIMGIVVVATHTIKRLSRAWIRALDFTMFATAGACISIMALEFGGVHSHYVHGITLVVLFRAACMADPWQRGLVHYAAICATFPGTILVASATGYPDVGLWLEDGSNGGWAAFVMPNFFLLGACCLGTTGSDAAWRVQREVFANRDLGRYRIERLIGRGGMGEVWQASHTGLKRSVALKILASHHRDSALSVRRFEREVWAISLLSHPHTIRILDHGVTPEGILYYAMELLQGEDLSAHLERYGPIEPVRCRRLALQAAASLAEAHANGLVHRDIKPSNLFLATIASDQDFLKVLDFGIAKLASDEATLLTGREQLLGTPRYMAPEVALGASADARSDVYSLGCVMYEMLAGRPALDGVSSLRALLDHLKHEPPRPSERLGRPVSKDFEDIVMRCLAMDPDHRYVDAAALHSALERCDG